MTPEFRQQLGKIPNLEKSQQVSKLEELRNVFNHTVDALDSDDLFFGAENTYNCFAYALNLIGQRQYIDIAGQYPNDVFANSDFVTFLLKNGRISETKGDGIIIYFSPTGKPTHAGRISGNSVKSKWGTGLLFKHNIFDIPISYGNNYKKYVALKPDLSLEYFYDFAETKGREFEYQEP